LIKEKLEQSTSSDEINPISQLIQIQQARKEKEPVYTVVDERGTARRREFVIEVSVSGVSATGTGPNKKMAKKIAAENLLISMGVLKTSSTSAELSAKEKQQQIDRNKKVQFVEPDAGKKKLPNPRQIAPGLLIVSGSESFSTPTKATTTTANIKEPESSAPAPAEKSTSPHSNTSNNDSGIGENGVSPRDQLNYLAQLIGFQVSYSDFPKGNHTEFLSLVTLTTDPPHMSHGSGSSIDESRDHAAMKALGALSELGLDNVKPKGASK
jgi:double-stranded RNA-binding protein Staufen